MTPTLHFIKLGGSLITDKNRPLTPRPLTIQRLAAEIARAYAARPDQTLIISHGSGSYGHAVGRRYGTREGVHDRAGWQGFAQTGYVAAQLNRLVLGALLCAGLPAISLAPSALAQCRDGRIAHFHAAPIRRALEAGLVPLVFGDVAFDETRGGVIVSTEQVLVALASHWPPAHISLVGVVDGVYDADPLSDPQARRIPTITLADLPELSSHLQGSHGIDVTGGMLSKVQAMAELVRQLPQTQVHLLSGEIPGRLERHIRQIEDPLGTTLRAA
ncbi:MAG: uridylate kinase [Caldilineae bacterium]|nr:MAG: uridylate kinase [Caldilineae bacterium]